MPGGVVQSADGERAAVVGFAGQYGLAARIVRARLPTLEWIRVADPAAGIADDFQFKAGATRHALQVKWSQYPDSFAWSTLVNPSGDGPALLAELAEAWKRLRETWRDPLVVHLCTNDYPSTARPRAGTPLGRATADGPRHFAAFIARSFGPVRKHIMQSITEWSALSQLSEIKQWASAWDALRAAAGLDHDQFVSFLRDFELSFMPHAGDLLLRSDREPADAEVSQLAATLQALVADPARPVQLSRDELLDRLGWSGLLRYRHPHRFPVPAVYTANESARAALEDRLNALTGGYVGLVGPAGSGKSTLLASLSVPGRVVRYYAFVPDAPDPLSGRGEADSFLHDLSLALEDGGLYRGGYGNDLPAQRAILTAQLDMAGRRWTEHGERTVIIVDGLDHIPREQNPTRSLLEELPAPAAVPDGVFVILGTQTADILHSSIQRALGRERRTVEVPPLAPKEVSRLARQAGPGNWLVPDQMAALIIASEGHPLALTYLLQDLGALESEEGDLRSRHERADTLLADASVYGRDIEERYRGYLRGVEGDPGVLDLLAAVARLRAPVNLDWLATWADPHALTAFVSRAGTFFRRNGAEWRFIHNSFRRFLADETSRVAGRAAPARDRQLHSALADLCAEADDWPVYRDEELAHRYLAAEHARVLEAATPQRLRMALLELRPTASVRDHALLALRASAALGDHGAYVRMLLFVSELAQREQVLKPEDLVAAVAALDPATGAEHIVGGGQLRLAAGAALERAAALCTAGDFDLGRDVMRACGGLAGLLESSWSHADREQQSAIADWAEVTWHLSGVDQVLTELDHLLPHPRLSEPDIDRSADAEAEQERQRDRQDRDMAAIAYRNLAHARCADLLVGTRDDDALDALTAVIDAEADAGWRARVRVRRAIAAAQDGMPDQALRWVREVLAIDATSPDEEKDDEDEQPQHGSRSARRPVPLQLRLRAAEALVRAGLADAPEINALIPPGTTATWPSPTTTAEGLAPFWNVISLHALREVCPDPIPSPSESVSQPQRPEAHLIGAERFRRALLTLARLEGQQLAAAGRGLHPAVAAHAGPIVRLIEVPRQQTDDWSGWYVVRGAAPDLLGRLVSLSAQAGGPTGLRKLLNAFDLAWTEPERAQHWSVALQQAVIKAALQADPSASPWARQWLERLGGDIDSRSTDPQHRVELWLMQARVWVIAGDVSHGRQAIQAAVRSSVGAGAHDDDRQLADWLDWLAAAATAGNLTKDELTAAIRCYALRIVGASQAGPVNATVAAERLIQLAFPVDPALACALAESFCEQGTVDEAAAVQAVTLAAARDTAVPVVLAAVVAASLLLPITRVASAEVAAVIRARSGSEEAVALLDRAAEVWTVRDDPADRRRAAGRNPAPARAAAPAADEDEPAMPPASASALLALMRATGDNTAGPPGGWDAAVKRVTSVPVSLTTARALLQQATRLQLGGAALGCLAALVARGGDTASARAALAEALGRTSAYGWLRYHDGGSRLQILGAALRDRDPELVALAANDLAGSLASRSFAGPMSPADLHDIAQLIAGPDTIAAAWPDVTAYLDEAAPLRPGVVAHDPVPATSPAETLMRWAASYLGHPVRSLDFGSRRVLQVALSLDSDTSQRVLAERVAAGGWAAEAALLTVVTAPPSDRPGTLSSDLTAAVKDAATGPDAICRCLARHLADRYSQTVAEPPKRGLPGVYHLALPPLRRRRVPILDSEGIPHLDVHDPQQVVAPFDRPLAWAAQGAGLKQAAVLNRAAMIATAIDEPWLRRGHRAQASRLKTRGQMHAYRPWAYMAGRRALGIVLAELLDADELGPSTGQLAYELGLVDERLTQLEVLPIDQSMPQPWRPGTVRAFDVRSWCDETPDAAHVYATATAVATPYVLAESSEWRGLEWGRPEETRTVRAAHGKSAEQATGPTQQAWEQTWAGASRYPDHLLLDWTDEELIVHGYEEHSDARWLDWVAFHPSAAARLGWTVDPDELFAWYGPDGTWRARTLRRAHGQLSHQPPGTAACAEGWQVVVSDIGHAELLTVFPLMTRTLYLSRKLPANRRESRPADERAVHVMVDTWRN